jgi:predicted GNAT family acetyltransferase
MNAGRTDWPPLPANSWTTSHGPRTIAVYTPPKQRCRGYGSAVTAAATRAVLEAGAVPVLYTDLANTTSNRIYQELGYYPVEDRLHVDIELVPGQ